MAALAFKDRCLSRVQLDQVQLVEVVLAAVQVQEGRRGREEQV